MPKSTSTVLIVGSGPTGLTLAIDLARRDIGVRIIDKSPQFPRSSRAKGPNPRSLEVLEDLGVIDQVLAAGSAPLPMRKYRAGEVIADTDPYAAARPTPDAPFERPWLIAQWRLEEILRARLAEYGVRVELGAELTGLAQDDDSVTASLTGGREIAARYVVGCDGGHSAVRKLLGVPFEDSTDDEQTMVCGDVEVTGPDRGVWHQWFDEDGGVMLCPIPGTRSGWWFQASPRRTPQAAPYPRRRPASNGSSPSTPGCPANSSRGPRSSPPTGSTSAWRTATGWAGCSWPGTPRTCTPSRAAWA